MNGAGSATNLADVLTVNYQKAIISGQPQPETTFVGTPVSISASAAPGTPPTLPIGRGASMSRPITVISAVRKPSP